MLSCRSVVICKKHVSVGSTDRINWSKHSHRADMTAGVPDIVNIASKVISVVGVRQFIGVCASQLERV